MPQSKNKITQFWQELKRRRVVKVIAMYAATAFIILEVVDIVAPSLGLPDWTLNLVIVLLSIGFPITVILSWIFDITPEGVVKTEPVEELPDQQLESDQAPVKKRISASSIIIALLLVVVCILLYPKIFKSDQFSKLRDEEGLISLAVLPFDNLTGDSSLYFWQNGISEYLINGLGNSDELAVWSSQIISDVLEGTRQVSTASLAPDIARRTASKIDVSTYITGNFIGSENDVSIMLNIMNTDNGELIWSTRVDGDLGSSYRVVLDQLSDTVINYMEIKALEDKVEADLSNAYPNSAEAYRHYITGLNAIVASNYESAIESLLKAYEIDTTFTFAAFYLAFAHNFSLQSDLHEGTILWTRRAHELKNNLPPAYHPWIELWYACNREDINDIRRYCDLLYEAALHNRFLILDLGATYSDMLGDYEKSIKAYEKVEELNLKWGDDWKYDRYYQSYSWTLLEVGRPEDAISIADKGLLINPGNGWLKLWKGSGNIMLGDTIALNRNIEELRTEFEKYNISESGEEHFIGLMYLNANDSIKAEEHYRKAYKLDPENLNRIIILARVLIESGSNIEEGLALTEKGLKTYPDYWELLIWKGAALYKLGKHEEALAIFNNVDENTIGYIRLLKGYIQEAEQALARQNQ